MDKKIILSAQNSGYFRSKKDDTKMGIVDEMLTMEEFADVERAQIEDVLQAETLRRHIVYQARAKRAIDKAQADAAKPLTGGTDGAFDHVQGYPVGRYVLTTAQNNTDVDRAFYDALRVYCDHMGARLLIAKTLYNKNAFLQNPEDTEGVYFDPLIVPYLVEGHISLGGCDFISSAHVSPTAKHPLSGFEAITPNGVHCVIPATQIALKCVAALKGATVKRMFATGSITKRNMVLRKTGAVASTFFNVGALFVDTTGGNFEARQLERMNGESGFYDEGKYFTGASVFTGHNPEVLQFGDIHAEKLTEENHCKMLELIRKYHPDNIMLHDVSDFSSRNHHNKKDPAFMFEQTHKGNTVKGDIETVTRFIDSICGAFGGEVHIVESNHDLALLRWVKENDVTTDPVNAVTYLRCMLALYESIERGVSDFNLMEWAYQHLGNGENSPIFHLTDESIQIAGIEHGVHGHTGINGAKGSPVGFRTLGVPMNTGHTHTPAINGAVYTAGVAGSLEMGYNSGPSSWQLANIVTWANGQRQVIFM